MSKRLVLVDGMAILHRAYHAYPLSLTAPDGELTNAVYGFTTILMTVIEKLKPSHVVVAWDVESRLLDIKSMRDIRLKEKSLMMS